MTLDDAICLPEKWQAKSKDEICPHGQLLNNVMSEDGNQIDEWVCMVCGELVSGPRKSFNASRLRKN